jgi:hypothetical protein
MYFGPETTIPLASSFALVLGVVMLTWRRGLSLVMALIRRVSRSSD